MNENISIINILYHRKNNINALIDIINQSKVLTDKDNYKPYKVDNDPANDIIFLQHSLPIKNLINVLKSGKLYSHNKLKEHGIIDVTIATGTHDYIHNPNYPNQVFVSPICRDSSKFYNGLMFSPSILHDKLDWTWAP